MATHCDYHGIADDASGIALIYLGPYNSGDEYSRRLIRAIRAGDLDEIEHVAALMICMLYARQPALPPQTMALCNEAWRRIWEARERMCDGERGQPDA